MTWKLQVPKKQKKWRQKRDGLGQNLNNRILIVVTLILKVKPTANEIWASGVYIILFLVIKLHGDFITVYASSIRK